MLAELAQQMRNEALLQGIEKGRKEGITMGEAKGMIKDKQLILKKLLSRKFQTSEDLLKQIEACNDPEKLDQSLEKILTAKTAEEVLELIK